MHFSIISALFSIFTSMTSAKPVAPIPGYTVTELQWEIEPSPGADLIKMNGTIEAVEYELARLNPTWKEDFAKTPSTFAINNEALAERYVTNIICNNFYAARATDFQVGINYLRGVPGRPYNGPGPGTCSPVSCSWNAGIWWCNDNRQGLYLEAFYHIANMGQDLYNRCGPKSGFEKFPSFSGQIFESGGWNVIFNGAYRC